MTGRTRSAHSANTDSAAAAHELLAAFAEANPRVIVFFASIHHDGAVLGRALEQRFPTACVLGCSSNGEFCDRGHGKRGVAALAIDGEAIGACAVAMADVEHDVHAGIRTAAAAISQRLGRSIRELDPEHWAGLVLLEGASGREERINAALGDVAPFLPFVGGSAGDDITFTGTWTWADGQLAKHGTALLVAEMRVPFRMFKTCHFVPTERSVVVTKSEGRWIHELDGQPAATCYARALGIGPDQLEFPQFLANPLGLMIDGKAWLRSGVRREGESLFFACEVVPGTRLNFMRATDMIEDARIELAGTAAELGVPVRGAVLFNCAYRMIEANLGGFDDRYHEVLSSVVHAGVQSNGESYLGHINQTLTGLVFG